MSLSFGQGTTSMQLNAGGTLYKGDKLTSSNSQYQFIFQTDGNLVLYGPGNKYMWDSKTNGKGNRCTLQSDGNLVMYNSNNQAVWNTETMSAFNRKYGSREYKPTYLDVSDYGQVALKSATGRVVWSVGNSQQAPAATGRVYYTFKTGSTLYPGDELRSSNDRYAFKFYKDGNIELHGPRTNRNTYIWNTGTLGSGAKCVLQSDGNLVVYDASNRPLWNSKTMSTYNRRYVNREYKPISLVITNNGDMNLISETNRVVWSDKKGEISYSSSSNTSYNTYITRGQSLRKGQSIYSPNGDYHLTFQSDGNLVLYDKNKRAIFNTGTQGKGTTCSLQEDGNLVVYDGVNRALWYSQTQASFDRKFASSDWKPYKLTVSNNGTVQLVSSTGRVAWEEPR